MDEGNQKKKVCEALGTILCAAHPLLFPDTNNSSTDDDSDCSDFETEETLATNIPRTLPKSRKYFQTVELMDAEEFKSHFRLGPVSFDTVVSWVTSCRDTPYSGIGLTDKQRTIITLYFLANRSSYRQVSQQFGVAISTSHDTVRDVVDAIVTKTSDIIKLPSTLDEIRENARKFATYGYPNVYGAIDGSAINVKVPQSRHSDFETRKFSTSINLTALCDSEKRYLDINVGHSEKCHDSHIFQMSALARKILGDNILPPQYHIIGDAAYGLHESIITPYKGKNLSVAQELHNNRHSSTRMVIERSFSDLKNRWMCLKDMYCDIESAVKITAACCVLHNLCVTNRDIEPTAHGLSQHDGNVELVYDGSGKGKRDAITNLLVNK